MPLFQPQKSWGQTMLKATRLMQRSLFGALPKVKPAAPRESAPAANDPRADKSPPAVIILPTRPAQPAPTDGEGRKASFTKHAYTFEGDSYPYRLYIPAADQAHATKLMPLVVLLHGCKQDALDFAHGTAMNTLAGEHNTMVLYPEQITSGNAMRCWNWFDPLHQQAGRGEPGMIAELTQKMITHEGADPSRIYVAGLSAGGAMAAVVANLYPHLFAAVGVHSGLAAGAAQSMMQAFSAMQEGAKGNHTTALPTIVFHGRPNGEPQQRQVHHPGSTERFQG
jgi:poly(hydroxyalkanoate) depolymerase family esterase